MIWALGIVSVLALAGWAAAKAGRKADSAGTAPACAAMRCPSCGEQVRIHGSTWECPWCGDFGRYGRK